MRDTSLNGFGIFWFRGFPTKPISPKTCVALGPTALDTPFAFCFLEGVEEERDSGPGEEEEEER